VRQKYPNGAPRAGVEDLSHLRFCHGCGNFRLVSNSGKAAAVDPAEPETLLAAAKKEGVTIDTIFTTHKHWSVTVLVFHRGVLVDGGVGLERGEERGKALVSTAIGPAVQWLMGQAWRGGGGGRGGWGRA
jgi:hypothetical protein